MSADTQIGQVPADVQAAAEASAQVGPPRQDVVQAGVQTPDAQRPSYYRISRILGPNGTIHALHRKPVVRAGGVTRGGLELSARPRPEQFHATPEIVLFSPEMIEDPSASRF
ncbi:MAG: hypothetical protein ACD_37C00275G0003 [uncultured bacterium]|nr:MAG: hypothetical protein ACD_37C00275G0003 [uncultured bacterium]